jgi:uncharacterized oxidoreductase
VSTALITGGGGGVGLALAERLLARGDTVLVCGRDRDRLDAATARLPGLRTVVADLADPDSVARLATAAAALPGFDLLVNNAAVQLHRSWITAERATLVDDLAAELATDLGGPLRLTAQLLPVLAAAPRGTIVNVTSALGLVPKRSAPVYCAAKAGLIAFTTALRYQVNRDAPHIRVVDAMLPLVDTAMTEGRGHRKISPAAAADGILAGLHRNRDTIRVGAVSTLLALHRLAPSIAARLVAD